MKQYSEMTQEERNELAQKAMNTLQSDLFGAINQVDEFSQKNFDSETMEQEIADFGERLLSAIHGNWYSNLKIPKPPKAEPWRTNEIAGN